MTKEREAWCWLMAALMVVVLSATMVGCSSRTMVTPKSSLIEATAPAAMASADIAEAEVILPAQPQAAANTAVTTDTASPVTRDADLSGLSIADVLVLGERWWAAVVERAPDTTKQDQAIASLSPARLDFETPGAPPAPLADSMATAQWAQAVDTAASQNADGWLVWATTTRPQPEVPAQEARPAQPAKYDAAGLVAMVVGGMILLFGGEAVVMLLLEPRREPQHEPRDSVVYKLTPTPTTPARYNKAA